MSRARPSVVVAVSVSLLVAAAAAGGVTPDGPPAARGNFVARPTGDDVTAGLEGASGQTEGTAASSPLEDAASGSDLPSDQVADPGPPPVTVLGPGTLAGFDTAAFDRAIADPLLSQGALSVSIALAKDGRLFHAAAYGVADPATGEAPTPDSRYRIASNSKMLTATTALRLVESGDLTLDEPGVLAPLAEQFGVELNDPRMADVTLRHLLSHTSGFADFTQQFFRGQAVGCEDATIAAFRGSLGAAPGRSFNYSNMNFCIAGLLIEIATGLGYEQAVGDVLLTPLGISGMRTTGNGDLRPGEVVHQGDETRNFMEVLGGAGAWVASASDMVRFLDSLDTSRPGWHPLSEEMAADMQGNGPRSQPARGHQFGMGLRVFNDGTWGHTGTITASRSMVIHQPDGYTWAVLVSGNAPSDSDDIRSYVRRGFAAIGVDPGSFGSPEPVDSLDPEADDRLFGRLDVPG